MWKILKYSVLVLAMAWGAGMSSAAHANGESAAIPKLTASAYLVLHNSTGKVLASKNANKIQSIASLTKLQAAMVVRARGLQLKKGTVISRADHLVAMRGARTRLELKWTYRNIDLLHAALLASDNRATSALGRAVKLDSKGLVEAMNELARRMGLKKTIFSGPVGIHHGNKSTCWEMARIVRQASKDPLLRKIMAKSNHMVKPMRGYLKVYYRNTNPMVGKKKGTVSFLATKTGYNDQAQYCLASVVNLKGIGEVTYVILGSRSKYGRAVDQSRLIKWVLSTGKKQLAKK